MNIFLWRNTCARKDLETGRRRLGGHHEPHRRVTGTSHDPLADPGPHGFGLVQSWLNQIPLHDEANGSVENSVPDTYNGYTSHWHPHNFPVEPVPPARQKFRHQRDRPLNNERPFVATPDPFLGDGYSETQYEASAETGSDKENKKRRRPHRNRDSLDGLSHEPSFERRPRRKTRTDRYTSKDQTGRRKSITKGETETSRKKSRSKKHHLRSSRDVMNNFKSGVIPNTRVTMKPNLTTGLFLNGRSSTFEQVTDLTFNNMTFAETQSEVSKNDEESLSNTDDEFNNDKDETLDDSGQSLKQHASISKTTAYATDAARDGGEEVREAHDEHSSPRMQNFPSQSHESQDNCDASNEITRVHDSGGTSVIFNKLMETGVFDGTGILEKIAQQESQSNATGLEELKILATAWVNKHLAYEDKGVRAGAVRDSPIRPDTQPPSNVTNSRPDDTNDVTKPTDTPHHEHRGGESPLHTCDPKQGDLDPQPGPIHSPSLAKPSTGNDTNELSKDEYPMRDSEEKQISGVNGRRQSVSQTSEGGHHYIRKDNNTLFMEPHNDHNGETMHEFIERIEGEAISRWDEPHQFLDDWYIDSTEDLLGDEFLTFQEDSNLLESNSLEPRRVTELTPDVLWPGHQPRPTTHGFQHSLEYWGNSDNQGYRLTGDIFREPDASEVEMVSFWRPNRF
ncbi:hypothetical protein FSARC_12741 [Fusarium sarcochroum]|uniref:Uncharacterized protein n=1 Tax=Fusarium sarcochroum TaxID=1208366 RepID=A0A8H4T672_9HYPO|nr:hypothetical protein FSARC_12741 [Fusarium sarcochroum]